MYRYYSKTKTINTTNSINTKQATIINLGIIRLKNNDWKSHKEIFLLESKIRCYLELMLFGILHFVTQFYPSGNTKYAS